MNILSKMVGFSLLALVLLAGCDPSGGGGLTVAAEYGVSGATATAVVVVAENGGLFTGSVDAVVNGETLSPFFGSWIGSPAVVTAGNPVSFVISIDGTQRINTSEIQPATPSFSSFPTSPSASSAIAINWTITTNPESFRLRVEESAFGGDIVYETSNIAGSATSHSIPAGRLSAGTGYDVTLFAVNSTDVSGDTLAIGSSVSTSASVSNSFTTSS